MIKTIFWEDIKPVFASKEKAELDAPLFPR
jgi:hypothetical protein